MPLTGLRIVRRASSRAMEFGLPAIMPAVWCYEVLLTYTPATVSDGGTEEIDETDLAWLDVGKGDGLREKVRVLFRSNQRLAQEHVGGEYLGNTLSGRSPDRTTPRPPESGVASSDSFPPQSKACGAPLIGSASTGRASS